jgi:nanoRNase/pAp phosphatase (c-di-AMP/oligoRNAs hydrolase)
MDKQIQTRIIELLDRSQKPLIVLPLRPSGDAIGAALALSLYLKKIGKSADVCCSEGFDSSRFGFLPGADSIKPSPEFVKRFIISVNTSNTKLKELSYITEDSAIDIFLKPVSGEFKPEDVIFKSGSSEHNLIICINVQSLDALGDLYAKNTEVFFSTPILNIDNSISNENFGVLQAVDLTAASNSEIVFESIRTHRLDLIDESIATCLLAGIVAATNSFQHARTTPQTFYAASELISAGAKQQEVIQRLFKTKHLSVLKLWGRAMARIKNLSEPGVMFSAISSQDLERSGSSESEAGQILDELVSNIPDVRLLFLAFEKPANTDVLVYANPNIRIVEVLNHFGGKQTSETTGMFVLNNIQLTGVEGLIENTLKNLKQRLGL